MPQFKPSAHRAAIWKHVLEDVKAGKPCPSHRGVAEILGVSRHAVENAFRAWVDVGVLKREYRDGWQRMGIVADGTLYWSNWRQFGSSVRLRKNSKAYDLADPLYRKLVELADRNASCPYSARLAEDFGTTRHTIDFAFCILRSQGRIVTRTCGGDGRIVRILESGKETAKPPRVERNTLMFSEYTVREGHCPACKIRMDFAKLTPCGRPECPNKGPGHSGWQDEQTPRSYVGCSAALTEREGD